MNTRFPGIEKLYLRVLDEVRTDEEKCVYFLKIYSDLVSTLTDASALHFNTLFARVSYIISRYQLTKAWSYAMQIPRRELKQRQMSDEQLIPILKATIDYLIALCKGESKELSTSQTIIFPSLPKLPPARRPGRFKKKFARVVAVEWDKENKTLSILDEEEPDKTCLLHYCVEGVNDIFSDTLELAIKEIGLPLILGLTDIDCTEEDQYIPGYIVIMPDLLIDVTSIAGAWSNGHDPLAVNVIDLFLPSESTEAIMIGQVANFFLDELIRDPNSTYADLFTRSFKIYPIEFVQMTDAKVKTIYNRMESHFDNILKAITERFPILGIEKQNCVIEPSYFSPQYGIKGRLDLYFQHENELGASIIELKSGKPFRPNSYGLSSSNYHQTLLYELLIKSVHGPKHHRANFILYSSVADDPLRFAVSVESLQKETIHNRNELVLLQFRMLQMDREGSRDIFEEIDIIRHGNLKGFIQKNISTWHEVYSGLSTGEKNYFKAFTSFITREHMLARIGSDNGEGTGGLAGLWLDKMESKEERYQILRGLELLNIDQSTNHTLITFSRSEQTNPLANFRAGDIAVMYPYDPANKTDPTKYQLHRANVISVNAREVVIKLRNIQIHTKQIENIKYWNLEHDLLDSSFRSLYQSLWAFMSSDITLRQRIFGLTRPPSAKEKNHWPEPKGLTTTQQALYKEALDAGPVYLLWGPPGTGKTSRMLKSWVWYYYFHTNSRIALLAYTNKAVDEICEALHSLGEEVIQHYIRIGSKAATGERYRDRLLDLVIEPMAKRSEIKSLLDKTRIFVATISSLQGKNEIFKLVDFDVAIIDEASQILEPTMVGLLTRFNKTILIGDHMQLPAVSTQSKHLSVIPAGQEWAARIGLTDKGMSYFERIYRLYSAKGWDHMIGILNEQGRMHTEIQAYANMNVYQHQLRCIDPIGQEELLSDVIGDQDNPVFQDRILYYPTTSTLSETYLKTNQHEASVTIELITTWQKLIEEKKLNWSIGVITPFRAQIASILHLAHQSKTNMKNVTVDTVERYQGGARDIIIMSCAVNNLQNLSRIMSLNPEGVDRKLNVAVTRARQQFILIGNESILMTEHSYRSLIGMSAVHQLNNVV
ncbi:MAG TPA: AAA domain-containing protein [Saprospiraceae bacterium]|nr:AAA domain-containing protein [Saprospiraceae bacterium]